jgi:hypothetical protein
MKKEKQLNLVYEAFFTYSKFVVEFNKNNFSNL